MHIEQWLTNKVLNSSNVFQYSTEFYPGFIPENGNIPAYVYKSIGFDKNRKNRNRVFSLTSCHNSRELCEDMNESLYNLFDSSSSFLRESSSSLNIISVDVLKNGVSEYDIDDKFYYRVLDISVWYYK